MAKKTFLPSTDRSCLTGFMGPGNGTVGRVLAGPAPPAPRPECQPGARPFLTGDEPLERKVVSTQRAEEESYSYAQWTPDTDDLTPEQAAGQISKRIAGQVHAQVH